MKKVYKHFAVVIVMLIAITGLSAHAGNPQPPTISSPTYTLYPPTNLHIIPIEVCNAYLTWDKPVDSIGNTPAGLLGYRIYRNGTLIHYTSDPDSLEYYDYVDGVGFFIESVTAFYDLTSYGSPGQYGESIAASVGASIECAMIMPFFEPWDLANFSIQMWTFAPSQGNWYMNTADGNPIPSASFSGSPNTTNYSYLLKSVGLLVQAWSCANLYFEFDAKSTINNPTSQEKLIPELYYDSVWHPLDSIMNDESTGWTHHKIDISAGAGKIIRVGFCAKGENSADLGSWEVDNILIYPVCFAPPSFNLNRNGNIVHLTWGVPCTDSSAIMGYNVYRTDGTGLPPYTKINTTYVVDTQYTDNFATGTHGHYCYFVTSVYKDTFGYLLCEPRGDTLCVDILEGITDQNSQGIRIFPNPVSDILNIQSDKAFTGIEVLNFLGEKVYEEMNLSSKNRNIPMKEYPDGIYMVKVRFGDRNVVRKVVKN